MGLTKIFKKDSEKGSASVIGLGKLGSPLAACLAHKGYRVHGVDVNPKMVDAINEGRAPVFEPGLEFMIHSNRERLSAGTDIEEAVLNTDMTFIVVATPSDESGGFSLRYVNPVCEKIANGLKKKDGWHLVVLTSTVMPGATQSEVVPLLEKISGKTCGKDFGLCYSPEFIALGSVLRDYLNPDFTLIGESDERSGAQLEEVYMRVCDNKPHAARMNFVNAELTKLSVNTFVTTKITFSNTLARMCEHLQGADVDVVSQALGLDTRIGRKYLKGAVGYGGPCFPRDTVAFSALARSVGVNAFLAEATDKANRAQVAILAELIKSKLPEKGKVGILGLSYKPNTDVVEESQGLLLAAHLAAENTDIMVYDPQAMDNARKKLESKVAYGENLEEVLVKSDVIVIVTPWDLFSNISVEALRQKGTPKVMIDAWRILDRRAFAEVCEYIGLGLNIRSNERCS